MKKGELPPFSEEDLEFWYAYRSSVKPLKTIHATPIPTQRRTRPQPTQAPVPREKVKASVNPQLVSSRRLKNVHIQARIDLHGLTEEQAHQKLLKFILTCHHQGLRSVLVITGKGLTQETEWWQSTGVLKKNVPRWLNEPPLKAIISAQATAHPRDGGSGALYVLLKR